MAIDFGRAARGIATGYISEVIRDRRQADQEKYENLQYAKRQYFEVDKPAFMKQEETRENNYNLISSTLTPVYGNYADAIGATANDASTRLFLKQIKDLSNEDQYRIESTFIDRKKGRVKSFDERTSEVRDFISNLPGGPGSTNLTNLFFPKEGEDPAEVGIGQGQATETTDTQTAAASDIPMMPMKSIMQIEGAGGNKYDIKVHGTERREFDTDFRSTFSNRLTGAPEIDVPDSDPRYELQQSLLIGYDDAVKNNYKDGKFSYMLNKYIDNQFKKQGIQGYPTGFPETKQETITQSDQQITDSKATVGDGAKFDAPDVSKIGAKEDLGINLQSIRKMEGGGAGSPATVINDLRDIISRISNSASLSDDEKSKRVDIARERAKERIKAMGLNPDNFNL
jgi:hypothetical protein